MIFFPADPLNQNFGRDMTESKKNFFEYGDMDENEGNIFQSNLKPFDYCLELNWTCLVTLFLEKVKKTNQCH